MPFITLERIQRRGYFESVTPSFPFCFMFYRGELWEQYTKHNPDSCDSCFRWISSVGARLRLGEMRRMRSESGLVDNGLEVVQQYYTAQVTEPARGKGSNYYVTNEVVSERFDC